MLRSTSLKCLNVAGLLHCSCSARQCSFRMQSCAVSALLSPSPCWTHHAATCPHHVATGPHHVVPTRHNPCGVRALRLSYVANGSTATSSAATTATTIMPAPDSRGHAEQNAHGRSGWLAQGTNRRKCSAKHAGTHSQPTGGPPLRDHAGAAGAKALTLSCFTRRRRACARNLPDRARHRVHQ